MIDNFKPLFPSGIVRARNVDELLELAIRMVSEEK